MGIVNVTPDSFSDGGHCFDHNAAINHALELADQGADLLDIGGESTRPGAGAVSEDAELRRVIPVIEALSQYPELKLSVDTSKPRVMQEAVAAGACLINDVMALRVPGALEMAAELGVSVSLMHMQGQPRTMQDSPVYEDVVGEVSDFLQTRVEACTQAGISRDRLIIDPGFGFGKNLDHNLKLLAGLGRLKAHGVSVLVGLSRKSMFGELLGLPVQERGPISASAAALAVLAGADILRCHDVRETVHAARLAQAVACRIPGEQQIFAN